MTHWSDFTGPIMPYLLTILTIWDSFLSPLNINISGPIMPYLLTILTYLTYHMGVVPPTLTVLRFKTYIRFQKYLQNVYPDSKIRRPSWRRASGSKVNNQISYTLHHIYRIPTITTIYFIYTTIYQIPYKFRTMTDDRIWIVFRARTGESCRLQNGPPTFAIFYSCAQL